MTLKARLIKDTMLYSAANYVAMAVGVVLSIASKAVLGVAGAGYWALLKIFLSYAGLADLGAKEAMLRDVSQALGAQDRVKAEATLGSSFAFLCVTAALFGGGILIASFFAKDPVLKSCFWVLALLVIATQVYNFMLTFLRVSKNVKVLSKIIVLNIMAVAVLSLACAYAMGVLGFAMGTLAATILSAALAYRGCGLKLRFSWNGAQIAALVRAGLPLVIASYALDTFLSLDALMIGRMIGVEALGFYTIALMSIQQINSLGRFSQIVLIPHAQETYGKSKDITDTKPFFLRTTLVLVHVLPVVIAMVYFLVPVLVHWFIPKFMPGLPAMKILVLGYFFVAVNELSTSILFTINKQKMLIPMFAAMIGLGAALNYCLIRAGLGIEGVAVATGVSYFLYFLVLFCFAFGHLLSGRELYGRVLRVLLVFVYFVLVILNIEQWVSVPGVFWPASLKAGLFLLLFSPFLFHLERKEGVFKTALRVLFNKSEILTGV